MAKMSAAEFKQLVGNIEKLCVFAADTIGEYASVIKTGARHSYAKYFLFPVVLRRKFQTSDFDFERMMCGKVEYSDMLYVVYGVPRRVPKFTSKGISPNELGQGGIHTK